MDRTVVVDGQIGLRNVIDGDVSLREVVDGNAYPVIVRSGGSNNYERLTNKPQIESVTLIGNKSFEDLGLEEMSAEDIIRILR